MHFCILTILAYLHYYHSIIEYCRIAPIGSNLTILADMKTKNEQNISETVSPIFESSDKLGNGILGFTIKHEDGTFKNVMQSFTAGNRDLVLAELTIERESTLNQILQEP